MKKDSPHFGIWFRKYLRLNCVSHLKSIALFYYLFSSFASHYYNFNWKNKFLLKFLFSNRTASLRILFIYLLFFFFSQIYQSTRTILNFNNFMIRSNDSLLLPVWLSIIHLFDHLILSFRMLMFKTIFRISKGICVYLKWRRSMSSGIGKLYVTQF